MPTHLYGLAVRHGRAFSASRSGTICASSKTARTRSGRTYDGRPVGTLGDAAIFSFQTLKPLNLYGGGLALVRDPERGRARSHAGVRGAVADEKRVTNRLLVGRLQRIFIKPWVFTISAFPILWVSALIDANPDVYLWEKIRSLDPLPDVYTERFPNVQAAIGLAALEMLDEWTDRTRAARRRDGPRARAACPASACRRCRRNGRTSTTSTASTVRNATNWSSGACGAASTSRRCTSTSATSWRCSLMPAVEPAGSPGAVRAAGAMQIPVYSTLTDAQIERVARVVKDVLAHSSS